MLIMLLSGQSTLPRLQTVMGFKFHKGHLFILGLFGYFKKLFANMPPIILYNNYTLVEDRVVLGEVIFAM